MHTVKKDVKLKQQVVAVVDIDVYENLAEAVKALTEVRVLELVNRQNACDITNAERTKHRPSAASKKLKRQLAYQLCDQKKHPDNYKKLLATVGDLPALLEFLDSLAPEVERLLEAGELQAPKK